MPIRYEVVANNLKPGSYYPRALPGDRVPLDRMIADIVNETALSETDVRAALNALTRRIAAHLSAGQVPELDDLVSFSVSIGEDLSGADAAVSNAVQIRINAQAAARLLNTVRERATLEKVYRAGRQPLVTALYDVASGGENVYTAGNIVRLRGDDLKFDPNATDEGVFFVGNGSTTRIATYAQAGSREIIFLVPPTVSGEQTVEVRTRYGTETLRAGRMPTTVRPALG
jgi:nucleoid DNA-binding protein